MNTKIKKNTNTKASKTVFQHVNKPNPSIRYTQGIP